MKSSYYDFFGELLLEVRGDGGRSTEQFRTMYDYFEVPAPNADPDVVVERTTDDVAAETVLGDPDSHYGWTGDRFVVRKGSDYLAVEPGWDHVYVTPDIEPFFAIYLVEYQIRRNVVRDGRALVHASGVRLDGRTVLFPAWRGAGKTNTLLSLLRAGGDFLADDRLWVGGDGSVRGFPLSVNLQPYNIESFPEVEARLEAGDPTLRQRASQFVEDRCDPRGSIVEKGAIFLSRQYLAGKPRSFTDVSSLFPEAEYVDESTIDDVVVLQAAPGADRVGVEEISASEAVTATQAISFYEWNERLEEYFRAYDALVPGGSAVEEFENLVDAERRVFSDLFESVGTYRASIPRKANWGATGVDRDVVEAIGSLDQSRRITVND